MATTIVTVTNGDNVATKVMLTMIMIVFVIRDHQIIVTLVLFSTKREIIINGKKEESYKILKI